MDVLFQITRLKIDSNPFAKGFRDSGRVRLVRDNGDCICVMFDIYESSNYRGRVSRGL